MFYFSYGSNMSITRLKDRVPSAKVVCVAFLWEHDLKFHKISKDGSGKCDAYRTNTKNNCVIGVVFKIADSEKPALDKKEGLGYGYKEKIIKLTTQSGETIKATTYYAVKIDSGLKPYRWYLHHVLTGARENSLPSEYIKKVEETESICDPDPVRHEKEMAIYGNKSNQLGPQKKS